MILSLAFATSEQLGENGALELLKKMSRAELRRNEITWNAAVRALQQGTQWQLALDLLAQATPKGKKGAADAE
ncbi:hypothetical protein AK812_SmicGene46482, partial [Symbiodinium microadriaticum]